MGVSDREVLAQNFNIIDWLSGVIVNVLFNCQNSFVFICIFEFLGQLGHYQVGVLIGKVEQFELKINVRRWPIFLSLLLSIFLLFIDDTLGHFTLGHSLFIHFLEEV